MSDSDRTRSATSTSGFDCEAFVLASPSTPMAQRAARAALGSLVWLAADAPAAQVLLRVDLDPDLPAESYRVQVDADGAHVVGADYAGLFYGCVALRDLLPAEAWRTSGHAVMYLPQARICETPQLRWRGAMLDVVRHFLPLPDVLRFIDLMAAHRLNRLHFHLSDDQGWRVESQAFGQLNEIASWRRQSMVGHLGNGGLANARWDGTPHGGYYSVADLREIVAYAADRAITVVPEIDLPGHSTPLLVALPQLRVPELRSDDDAIGEVTGGWGVFRNVISPLPEPMAVLADLLGEVVDAVDSPYLHVGGDECDLSQWRSSPAVAEFMAERGLDGIGQLRRQVNGQLCQMARDLGRRPVVWDEAFVAGGLAEDVIVMVWRSAALGEPASQAGHEVVLAPGARAYFDHPESASPLEPLSIGGTVPTSSVASWNPMAQVSDSARLLGVQGNLWSEYLPSRRDLEYAAFPRLSVLAEVAWTGSALDPDSIMPQRLARLTAMGVNFRPPAGPHPWQQGGSGDRAAAGDSYQLQDPPLAAVMHSESVGHSS